MKKLVSLLLGLTIVFSAIGQITITGADLPQPGTSFLVANDTNPSISLGAPNASWQSWDYSALANHYPQAAVYGATSNTAYAADFPLSNAYTYGPAYMYSSLYGGAPVDQGTHGYMFWQTDNTGFWAVGWMADSGPFAFEKVHESPPELLIGVPATYGTVFNNSSRWELPMNNVPTNIDTFYIVNRTKTLTADAWGELITPYDTFPDVLRIHEYVIEHDSVRTQFMVWDSTFLFSSDTSNIYTYIANGIGYPVAIVHADKNNVIKDVEYLIDSTYFVGINRVDKTDIDIKLYPNPASQYINLELPEIWGETRLVIYDVTGREQVKQVNIFTTNYKLSIAKLPMGIYLCRFTNEKGLIITKTLIKK